MTSASLTDRTLGAGGATRPAATAATPDSVSQADPGDSPDSLPGLWEAVLTALQRDPAISRANFATWLRNTQLLCGPVDETTQGSAGDGAASPKG
ncbi:MAG: hypothetical protein ACRDI2_02840, partial [Chloroflexota bacterium]